MEKVILTERLELTLQQTAEKGSDDLRNYHMLRSDAGATLWSFSRPDNDIEETQRVLIKNHLPVSEFEGDLRQYRASYNVYLRSADGVDELDGQLHGPSRFIGRVGAKECAEYGVPFSDDLTIPKDVLEKEKILKMEVGYTFLEKSWGKGYAPEATRAFVDEYLKPRGFWNPQKELVYLHAVVGSANFRSRRVLEKIGFKHNGIHRWEGPDVFIGGAMQPPEVHVYSLGPSVAICDES